MNSNNINSQYSNLMLKWAKDLFPICRSITGEGTRKTIYYLKKINKELKILKFKSGTKVFDWKVPFEWNIENAYIEHSSGKRFAEFNKNNLHILHYSIPIQKNLTREKLLPNIYTQPDQPNRIPYVTSYYAKRWGFCMSHNEKKKLPKGNYKVSIKSKIFKGQLNIAEAFIKGKKKNQIIFSTNICHPSMANNELSGLVLSSALIKYIKNNFKKTNYSYKFLFVPETIGPLTYLSKNLKSLKKNTIAGFVLSCVGDNRAYSYIESRLNNTLSDLALSSSLIDKKNVKKYSYLERGSDERQYCAPGIDLPMVGFCRSKYDTYPEYHTDADNFDVLTKEGLTGSFMVMKNIIDAFENGLYPKSKILGEPNLGKRNLYPTVSQKGHIKKTRLKMNLLSYSDGKKNTFEISKLINTPLATVNEELTILKSKGLISN